MLKKLPDWPRSRLNITVIVWHNTGISVEDVNSVLRAAFAGSQAGVVFDEEKRFGLVVRLDKDYRQNLDDIKNLTVALPGGQQIPFEQIADISVKSGPAQVSRENTKRRITIGFNVRNRDIKSVINDVSQQIDSKVKMPTGYYISYGGQFKNLEAAQRRLSVAVPIALLLIFDPSLFYFSFCKTIASDFYSCSNVCNRRSFCTLAERNEFFNFCRGRFYCSLWSSSAQWYSAYCGI